MKNIELRPTLNQTFELVGRQEYDFVAVQRRAERLQSENRIEEACNVRYAAVQRLVEVLPEDEEIVLEWSDRNSRAALEVVEASARDHLLIGDYEMAAALAEMALDLDPEDHLEVVILAAFCYVALGEYELFDEIAADISDKAAEKQILALWASFRRTGTLHADALKQLRQHYPEYYDEFTREEHPADDSYRSEMENDAPSRKTQARHLWLQTQSLWEEHRDFTKALAAADC